MALTHTAASTLAGYALAGPGVSEYQTSRHWRVSMAPTLSRGLLAAAGRQPCVQSDPGSSQRWQAYILPQPGPGYLAGAWALGLDDGVSAHSKEPRLGISMMHLVGLARAQVRRRAARPSHGHRARLFKEAT